MLQADGDLAHHERMGATGISGLARAAHAGPTVAVTTLAGLLAAGAGAPVAATLAAVLSGQLQVGWLNDLLDQQRDARLGRSDKPLVSGAVSAGQLRWAIGVATVAVVPLSLIAFGALGGLLHLIAVLSAQAYNLRLKSTWLSWLPYALSFALLPTAILFGAQRVAEIWPWAPAGALLGMAAHLANVVPDIDGDRRVGVNGLPQRMGARASRLGAILLLVAVALLLFSDLRLVALLAGFAVLLAWAPPRLLFMAIVVLAGVDVVLLLDSLRP